MAVVYRHIRLDKNEVFYIGIGKEEKRAYEKYRNKHWNHIVAKTKYEIEILFDDLTWEEACIKEKEFIKLYGRRDLGLGTLVNLTDGGEGQCGNSNFLGKKHSIESKKKISEYNIGKKHSIESKKKISKTKTGVKHPNYPKNRNGIKFTYNDKEYVSIQEASFQLNIPFNTLKRKLKKLNII
jgi:hypothetical protein